MALDLRLRLMEVLTMGALAPPDPGIQEQYLSALMAPVEQQLQSIIGVANTNLQQWRSTAGRTGSAVSPQVATAAQLIASLYSGCALAASSSTQAVIAHRITPAFQAIVHMMKAVVDPASMDPSQAQGPKSFVANPAAAEPFLSLGKHYAEVRVLCGVRCAPGWSPEGIYAVLSTRLLCSSDVGGFGLIRCSCFYCPGRASLPPERPRIAVPRLLPRRFDDLRVGGVLGGIHAAAGEAARSRGGE